MIRMTTLTEVHALALADLRPIVQRALDLPEWPGDWPAVGLIFQQVSIALNSASFPPFAYSAVITGRHAAPGLGSAADCDPLVAIFRAFIIWKAYTVTRVDPDLSHL